MLLRLLILNHWGEALDRALFGERLAPQVVKGSELGGKEVKHDALTELLNFSLVCLGPVFLLFVFHADFQD